MIVRFVLVVYILIYLYRAGLKSAENITKFVFMEMTAYGRNVPFLTQERCHNYA